MLTKILKKIVAVLPPATERSIYWHNNRFTRSKKIQKWISEGRPIPPPHQYKQSVVEEIAAKHHLKILVETGTFKGHMVEAQRNNFEKVFSVELDQTLFDNAKKYFEAYGHIKIVQGDSAVMLAGLLDEIGNKPILFWLDGHYCGDNTGMGDKQCPIFEELETVFAHTINHKYILIDDARCFNGTYDYPTIDELTAFVKQKDDHLKVKILNDIIHIYNP